jgi:hypothetical protein
VGGSVLLKFPAIKEIAMNATRINDLFNAITLAAYLHKEFGEFSLAFEATVRTYQFIFNCLLSTSLIVLLISGDT